VSSKFSFLLLSISALASVVLKAASSASFTEITLIATLPDFSWTPFLITETSMSCETMYMFSSGLNLASIVASSSE
jgi:hypothetical protein